MPRLKKSVLSIDFIDSIYAEVPYRDRLITLIYAAGHTIPSVLDEIKKATGITINSNTFARLCERDNLTLRKFGGNTDVLEAESFEVIKLLAKLLFVEGTAQYEDPQQAKEVEDNASAFCDLYEHKLRNAIKNPIDRRDQVTPRIEPTKFKTGSYTCLAGAILGRSNSTTSRA